MAALVRTVRRIYSWHGPIPNAYEQSMGWLACHENGVTCLLANDEARDLLRLHAP